ncbi:hypothetical protein [Tomitella fengzijianii]|uniref:hypothetical protein n=1 Tax=Tomitella fengzijianii TaxID=2597660 RepID=UPI00131AB7AE|nr:hypothetical protein [Tomitella fengzijianii]
MAIEPAKETAQSDDVLNAAVGDALEINVEGDELLVTGHRNAVEDYIKRLTSIAGDAAKVSGLNASSLADGAAIATSVGAIAASRTSGLVQLSPESMRLLSEGSLIPGENGFYRMMVRGAQGSFTGQLQWQSVALQPAQILSLQTAMVAIALRTAVQGVENAVAEVQATAESILHLVKAQSTGSVIGRHQTLRHLREFVDDSGTLSGADWDSIATSGPQLEVATASLRAHVHLVLASLDQSLPVQDRAEKLRSVLEEGTLRDTLRLIVVAEDAACLWQSLRIDRVRTSEPQHLQNTISSARETLDRHDTEDAELLRTANEVINGYAKVRPFEILRKFSGKRLTADVEALRDLFDEFAEARRAQPSQWARHATPTITIAAKEAGHQINATRQLAVLEVRKAGNEFLDRSAAGIGTIGDRMQKIASARAEKNESDEESS